MLNNLIKKGLEIGKMMRRPNHMPPNRLEVGKDRQGNTYFQHFNDDGFESKRECFYFNDFDKFRYFLFKLLLL